MCLCRGITLKITSRYCEFTCLLVFFKHWDKGFQEIVYNTRNLKLKLICNEPQIISYSDADFASNRDDRISMGDQIICLNLINL